MSKLQIAFLIPTLDAGGSERAVSNLSLSLNRKKYDISIIVFDGTNIKYQYFGNLIDLKIPASRHLLSKLFGFIKRYFKLKKIKKVNQFDYVISFLSTPNILNILTNTKNTRNIVSIRNYDSLKKKSLLYIAIKFVELNLYKKAYKIVAVTELIKRDLNKKKAVYKKTIVINNGFDISSIKKKSQQKIEENYLSVFSKPNVITIGRLTYQKGQWLLIEATRRIVKVIPDFQLVIIGKGELKSKLMIQIDEYKLRKNVTIIDHVLNPFKFISKSNMFVLSSLYEGFPNVLIEAMACGVPVISTDCLTGPREILAPNYIGKNIIDYENIGEFGYLIDRPIQSIDIDKNEYLIRNLSNKIISILISNKFYTNTNKTQYRAEDFNILKIIKLWEKILD